VEIVKAKEKRPSRDWLNPKLGYAHSSRTKQKIRYWFRKQERDRSIVRGREILERELRRSSQKGANFEDISSLFNYKKPEDLFEAIGRNDVSAQHISEMLIRKEQGLDYGNQMPQGKNESRLSSPSPSVLPKVLVKGMKDFLTRTAQCCLPLPGDDIVGFVTRGRGVTIHRRDCYNIARQNDKSRLIDVEWGKGLQKYPVKISVEGTNVKKLFKEMATIIENDGANILASSLDALHKDPLAMINATIEIASIDQLKRIMNKIKALPYTSSVQRLTN
jgi:GTP pyrophosphokinase